MNYKVLIAATLAATVAQAGIVDTNVPQPWFKNGQPPASNDCQAGVDPEMATRGTPNMTLKCESTSEGFVGIMQNFSAVNYLGKRVRFSALVKAENVEGWAGLWMRIDDKGGRMGAFDNMQDRPINGTSDWTPYSVILDTTENADGIFFGTLMSGKGQIWITGIQFEVVTDGSAPTNRAVRTEPGNLSLSR